MRASIGMIVLAFVCGCETFAQGQQDAAAVCAVAERHYAAVRAGDVNTILQLRLPEFTLFASDGGLLWTFRSLDQQRNEFEEMNSSFPRRPYIRHCNAQVYGDVGIATYYLAQSATNGVNTTSRSSRVTEVWVKHGNDWKGAHHHESPLLGSVPP